MKKTLLKEHIFMKMNTSHRNQTTEIFFLGNYTCASDISCKFAKEIERKMVLFYAQVFSVFCNRNLIVTCTNGNISDMVSPQKNH